MKPNLTTGLAIAVLACAMSIGDARANWPEPGIACDASNAGEFYTLEAYLGWPRTRYSITYNCDGGSWQLWSVCDLSPGGICYAY
jgi:hypothetical protein